MDELYSVDKQYKAFATIKENIQTLKIQDAAHVYKMDYQKALQQFANQNIHFDLVFLDPPYGLKISQKILDFLVENCMLKKGCILVIEDLNEETIEIKEPFVLKKQQSYGITTLQIIVYEE